MAALGIIACSDSEFEDAITTINPQVEAFLKTKNLDASSPEDIQYISDFKDSLGYTLVWGMKDSAAWVSKFNASGNEEFCFILKNWAGGKKYSHTNKFSLVLIDNNLMFVKSFATDSPNPNDVVMLWNTFLSIIDINTGTEISRMPIYISENEYRLHKHQYGYMAEDWGKINNGDAAINMIDVSGNLIWSRLFSQKEKPNGLKTYLGYAMINTEKMIYNSTVQEGIYVYQTYIVINLRTEQLQFEIKKNTFPFNVSTDSWGDVFYELYSASESGGKITLSYNKKQRIKIIDNQYTGAFHYEYTILEKLYCEINTSTGAIEESGVL